MLISLVPKECSVTQACPSCSRGFSLVEILVSIVIITISLLGMAGLQARAVNSEFESYQREQALLLAYGLAEGIKATRADAAEYRFITSGNATGTASGSSGAPYLGTPVGTSDANWFDCTTVANTRVQPVLCNWDNALLGTGTTVGPSGSTTNVGSIVAARGCVFYDASTEVAGPGTGTYSVVVSWQGNLPTAVPVDANGARINCGNGTYTAETNRRSVVLNFTLPRLGA